MNIKEYIADRENRIKEGKKLGLNRTQAFFRSTAPTREQKIEALKASMDKHGIKY